MTNDKGCRATSLSFVICHLCFVISCSRPCHHSRPAWRAVGGDRVRLGDHNDACLGHEPAAGAVLIEIEADLGPLGEPHALVDDRAADTAVTANLHAVEQD